MFPFTLTRCLRKKTVFRGVVKKLPFKTTWLSFSVEELIVFLFSYLSNVFPSTSPQHQFYTRNCSLFAHFSSTVLLLQNLALLYSVHRAHAVSKLLLFNDNSVSIGRVLCARRGTLTDMCGHTSCVSTEHDSKKRFWEIRDTLLIYYFKCKPNAVPIFFYERKETKTRVVFLVSKSCADDRRCILLHPSVHQPSHICQNKK